MRRFLLIWTVLVVFLRALVWGQLGPFFNNSQVQPQFPLPFGPQPFQQGQFGQPGFNVLGTNTMANMPCIYMGDMRMIDRRAEEGRNLA